jgi:polysaccharide pyruvyl transferase WcaK-like protein
MNIALVGTNPFSTNRGVSALGYSVLYIFEQIAKEYNLKFEYYILNTTSLSSRENKVIIDNDSIDFIPLRQCTQKGIKGFTRKIVFLNHYRQYSKFDYVFDVSEGDSFSDIYGNERFYWHNSIKQYFIKKRIKLVLLPQTIGPFNHLKIKKQAVRTIEKCGFVLTRDRQSYDFLKSETNQAKIDDIIDMAFFMPYKKTIFQKDCLNVGINISALLWHGGYTKDNQFGLKVDYQSLTRNIIEYFLTMPNVTIHLVAHVLETDYTTENDYAITFELVQKYQKNRIILAPFFLTPILAKNYISGLDFFVGARMHATIAAFSSLVPVYPLAYSRKFNGLYYDTLNYPYLGDMKVQSIEEIITGIKKAFENKDEMKKVIQERMDTIVGERKERLKNHIIDFLGLSRQ